MQRAGAASSTAAVTAGSPAACTASPRASRCKASLCQAALTFMNRATMKSNCPATASSPLMIFISTVPSASGRLLLRLPLVSSAAAGSVVSTFAAALSPARRRPARRGAGGAAGGPRGYRSLQKCSVNVHDTVGRSGLALEGSALGQRCRRGWGSPAAAPAACKLITCGAVGQQQAQKQRKGLAPHGPRQVRGACRQER